MMSLIGRLIGDFRLETQIGTGLLGVVYAARHVSRGSRAAIKVIHPAIAADRAFGERFARVAATTVRLRHPHIVTVDKIGEDGDQFFIIMELLEHGSLRTLVDRRDTALPLARGVEYVRQAAEALVFAHAEGIVHRDLKPENLLVAQPGAGGSIKVVDWGLMRLIDTGVTMVGNLTPGSPKYMSPEQCKGGAIDARSDVYSLGIVLYEVATGHPPFQVDSFAEAATKHLTARPPRPSAVDSNVPAVLERIILRCLEKKPEDRYASAADLEADLRGALREMQPVNERKIAWRGEGAAPPTPASDDAEQRIRVRFRDRGAESSEPPAPPRGLTPPLKKEVVARGAPPAAPPKPPDQPPVGAPADALRVPERERIRVARPPDTTSIAPTLPVDKPRGAPSADEVVAAESKRIKIVVDRSTLVLTPGQPEVVNATLMNGGKTVDHFPITVEGVPSTWVQTPAAPPQLNPGERVTIALRVNVPRVSESLARTYPVTIRASAVKNPAESGTASGQWTVLPFAISSLTLTPTRRRAWRRAGFSVRLRNDGNFPARYRLSGADDEEKLTYRFGHPEIALGAGDAVPLHMEVAGRTRWFGAAEPRRFVVRAEPVVDESTAPLAQTTPTVGGEYVQRAFIPLWVPPVLVAAAALLLFLIPYWRTEVVTVAPPRLQVSEGDVARVTASVTNRQGEAVPDQTVRWRARDTTIATVDDSGIVHGKRVGTTLLTATRGRKTTTSEVDVVLARTATLTVTPPAVALRVGNSARLRATAKDGSGTVLARDATWQSSDPSVVTVGGNGRVVARDTGSATITAMVEGKVATAEVRVRGAPAGAGGGGGEDCEPYEPAALQTTREQGVGFVLGAAGSVMLTLDSENDAKRALALARGYKSHCYLGRGNSRPNRSDFITEYWKVPSGAQIAIDAEDCEAYSRSALRVVDQGPQGFAVLEGTGRRLVQADNQADAQMARTIAQQHTRLCFIGRGNKRPNQRDYIVQYWR